MKYKITVGDWSDDGHGKTETFIVDVVGASRKQMFDNYKRNVDRLGFDPQNIANEYEDSYWPREAVEKLQEVGFPFPEEFDIDDEYYSDWLDLEMYVNLIMFFMTNGLNVAWGIVKGEEMPTLIGGYDGYKSDRHTSHFGYGYFH